jgi:hypothetical protein
MQQKPGNLTDDWYDKQVAMYEKSIADLLKVATIKPCLS